MAFFSKLKAFFGFGDLETEEELNEKFLPYEAQHRTPYINPFKKEDEEETKMEISKPSDGNTELAKDGQPYTIDELPQEMFNGVLSIINSTLPSFLRECLDIEAEKRAIARTLEPHIKQVMQEACAKIEENASLQWESERSNMAARIDSAEAQSKEAADRAEQAQVKAQSADAQRKAVSERCRTLENRVAELEAEREQFDLENKSLLNKVKVAQVHADDANHYREEAEELRRQIAEMKERQASDAENNEEIANLKKELADRANEIKALTEKNEETETLLATARKELDEAIITLDLVNSTQGEVDKLNEQLTAREAEIETLREQWKKREEEAARNFNEVNNANLDLKLQYDLLKAEAKKLREAVDNAESEKVATTTELQQSLAKAEKEVETLKSRINALKLEHDTARKEAAEKAEAREQRAESIAKQLEVAAGVIEQRDITIKQMNDRINALEGEISYAHMSDSENRLKIKQLTAELENEQLRSKQLEEQLTATTAQPEETPAEPEKSVKRGRPAKSKPEAESALTHEPETAESVLTPEPELEEAVKQVFGIDINNDTPTQADEISVVAEVINDTQEPEPQPIEMEKNTDSLPIDNSIKPVEPIDTAAMAETSLDELDNTLLTPSDETLPELEDDIEWLIPTAEKTATETTLPEDGDFVMIDKHEKVEKEEPKQQQQMSLF